MLRGLLADADKPDCGHLTCTYAKPTVSYFTGNAPSIQQLIAYTRTFSLLCMRAGVRSQALNMANPEKPSPEKIVKNKSFGDLLKKLSDPAILNITSDSKDPSYATAGSDDKEEQPKAEEKSD
jgi:hypothetical protein